MIMANASVNECKAGTKIGGLWWFGTDAGAPPIEGEKNKRGERVESELFCFTKWHKPGHGKGGFQSEEKKMDLISYLYMLYITGFL